MPTWVVVLIVLGVAGPFVIGVLAVLGIYGMRMYIANAKQAEALASVGQMAKNASAAYERDPGAGLCASASRSVPSTISYVRGMRYQSAAADWAADASRPHAGFACLRFSLEQPQYYMYSYRAHGARSPGDGFSAIANGDLNGDGVVSTFQLRGKVDATGALVVDSSVERKDPGE